MCANKRKNIPAAQPVKGTDIPATTQDGVSKNDFFSN